MLRAGLGLRTLAFAAALALVAVLPRYVSDFRASELAYVGIFFIAILGLNILTGYTGQISLGHGAYMAIGGYTTAILVVDHGVKDLWTIPVAGLVAGLVGFLFGIPALRLSGLYLALATFAVAVATPAVIKKAEGLTGGSRGLNLFGVEGHTGGIAGVSVLGRHLTFNDWLYYLSWTIAASLFLVAWAILRGRPGRAFRAVRDSEVAATASGVNLAAYKTLAFGISAFYAGVAGALFTIANTFVNPTTFPVVLSITLLIGVVVGGLGSLTGVVVGALFVRFLPTGIDRLSEVEALPERIREASNEAGVPDLAYGIVLILVVLLVPGGAGGLLTKLGRPLTSRLYSKSRELSAKGGGG